MSAAADSKDPFCRGEILVIEDNPIEREILSHLLREAGCSVRGAVNGEDGLRQVLEKAPELILLDVCMEGLDGFELCRSLKGDPSHRSIPIIFLTGLQNPGDKVKGLRAGAADYITKPYEEEEMLVRIRTHLELRRTQLRLADMLQQRTEALRESQQLLEVAVAQSPSGIIIADAPDGTIRYANAAALAMRGGSAQGLTGIHLSQHALCWQIFRSDGSPYPLQERPLSRAVMNGETTRREVVLMRDEQGTEHWININAAPILDSEGRISAGISIFHDISAQKAAEIGLAEREERLRLLLEATGAGFWDVDPKAGTWSFNDRWSRIVGYGVDELMSSGDPWPRLVHPEDLPRAEAAVQAHLEGKTPFYSCEYRMRHKDGHWVWVDARGVVVAREPDGEPRRFMGYQLDISERRAVQEALENSQATFKAIFRESQPMSLSTWPQTVLLDMNEAWTQLNGLSREEALGHSPEALELFADEEDRRRVLADLAAQGQVQERELRIRRRDGTLRTILWSARIFSVVGEQRLVSSAVDITNLRQAALALQASEARFRNVFEACPDGMALLRLSDHVILERNRSLTRLSGCSVEELAEGAARPGDPVLLANLEGWERHLADVQAKGSASLESPFRRKDGAWAMVRVSSVLLELDGQPCALCVLQDLTEQRNAERLAWENEQRLQTIFDGAPLGLFRSTLEGRLLQINASHAAMHGYDSPSEMLDEVNRSGSVQTLWEHPEDRQAFIEKIKASPGRYCEQEARFRRKDGSLLEAYLSMMLTTDLILNEPYLVGFIYDITERKRAEAALRLSLDQLRANLENTPNVAVQWFDEVGRVLYWNPASEAMYGWSAAETLGKTLEAFAYSREEGREFQEVLQRVRTTGSPVGPSELHIHRKDGSECWVMSTTFTMPLGEGRIGCVSMDVDITERKQAEEGKERLNAQLLQAQKMEVVGRLAGGVAHDFNNMLGVILGRADLALSLVDPGNAVHNSLKEILKAARHSADLTRQLLAFARQQAVAPRILDLNDTVEGMLKVLRRLIGEHIELAWMPSAALWPLRMDPSQIDQILANLCVNARDAIQGVGRIRLETRNVSVDEEYCAAHFGAVPGEYVQLTVNDNGRGMAAEVLEHLFEPFFTTKGLGRGTGLGLATVYGIVQQNEGFIHVYSELGHGSTFRIYLPRSAQEAPEDPQEPKARMPRGHGELLLMVEDDEALRTFSRDALLSLGYRVLDAGFPLEALQLEEAHRGQIRLLVTDVIMPGMNGRELAERLRARQPELLCLFISGYTADIITEQGVLAEGLAFLQKPYSLRELAAKVHEMLDAG